MGLGIKKGDNVQVIIEGPDEEAAAQKIETLFREQL